MRKIFLKRFPEAILAGYNLIMVMHSVPAY